MKLKTYLKHFGVLVKNAEKIKNSKFLTENEYSTILKKIESRANLFDINLKEYLEKKKNNKYMIDKSSSEFELFSEDLYILIEKIIKIQIYYLRSLILNENPSFKTRIRSTLNEIMNELQRNLIKNTFSYNELKLDTNDLIEKFGKILISINNYNLLDHSLLYTKINSSEEEFLKEKNIEELPEEEEEKEGLDPKIEDKKKKIQEEEEEYDDLSEEELPSKATGSSFDDFLENKNTQDKKEIKKDEDDEEYADLSDDDSTKKILIMKLKKLKQKKLKKLKRR